MFTLHQELSGYFKSVTSADGSTILASHRKGIYIYKLIDKYYELFQTIEYKQGVPINLFVSDNGDVIKLKMYSSTNVSKLKYQQRGSRYILTDY